VPCAATLPAVTAGQAAHAGSAPKYPPSPKQETVLWRDRSLAAGPSQVCTRAPECRAAPRPVKIPLLPLCESPHPRRECSVRGRYCLTSSRHAADATRRGVGVSRELTVTASPAWRGVACPHGAGRVYPLYDPRVQHVPTSPRNAPPRLVVVACVALVFSSLLSALIVCRCRLSIDHRSHPSKI
jgi:hypothetical protein